MSDTRRNERDRRFVRSGGFTLIELIAIVSIVGILAAAAVPTLVRLDDARCSLAARQLLRDATLARQVAVATGTRTWVVFDVAGDTWTLLQEDPVTPGRLGASVMTDLATGQPYVVELGTGSFRGVALATATFDGGGEVGFDWLGRPLNDTEAPLAADGTVTLTGGHLLTVTMDTGHVSHAGP